VYFLLFRKHFFSSLTWSETQADISEEDVDVGNQQNAMNEADSVVRPPVWSSMLIIVIVVR